MGGNRYSIVFKNNSTYYANVCIYQTNPDLGPRVMSLAWFSQQSFPNTERTFDWTDDYCFVWADTGRLDPGIVFEACECWDANLSNANTVTFGIAKGAYYCFSNLRTEGILGKLHIVEDSSIPLTEDAAVGIGMSGQGTFVTQARPNMALSFEPHPEYWIAFGNYEQGMVLDINTIPNPQRITFGPGINTVTATLNPDNTWSVTDK